MHYCLAFLTLLGLVIAAPASAQDTTAPPIFKQPPASGTVSGSRGCVSVPYTRQRGVLKQVDRGLPPPYVPKEERVSGSATATVMRETERTFLQIRVSMTGDTLPGVADRLGTVRRRLETAIAASGYQILSIDVLDASITEARPAVGPESERSAAGSMRLSVLLAGDIDEQELTTQFDDLETVTVEQMVFDFADADTVAEDLRPELEARVRADAAARAAAKGAELAGLLSSDLTSQATGRSGVSRKPGQLTVNAKGTFRMTPMADTGGN